jgi:hypothetical protein
MDLLPDLFDYLRFCTFFADGARSECLIPHLVQEGLELLLIEKLEELTVSGKSINCLDHIGDEISLDHVKDGSTLRLETYSLHYAP